MPEAPSDMELEFDVNGEIKTNIEDFNYHIPWDPKPQELGSDQPIPVTLALKQDKQRVFQELQAGQPVQRSPMYLTGIYAVRTSEQTKFRSKFKFAKSTSKSTNIRYQLQ